jgi:hypothetical protein
MRHKVTKRLTVMVTTLFACLASAETSGDYLMSSSLEPGIPVVESAPFIGVESEPSESTLLGTEASDVKCRPSFLVGLTDDGPSGSQVCYCLGGSYVLGRPCHCTGDLIMGGSSETLTSASECEMAGRCVQAGNTWIGSKCVTDFDR